MGSQTVSWDQLDFEAAARQVYDAFLLAWPDVPVEGLFRQGFRFFIVGSKLDIIVEDGLSVQRWFDDRLKPLGYPIELVGARPRDCTEVSARSVDGIRDGTGVVRTRLTMQRDLALLLETGVPLVSIESVDRESVVYVSRALTEAETRTIDTTLERIGSPSPHRIEVTAVAPPVLSASVCPERLALSPTRWLPAATPPTVRALLEEDEDFWRANYRRLFAGELTVADALGATRADLDTCLVGTTFPPQNLRSYLSLYRRVVLGMPLSERVNDTLAGLGVSKGDLLELVNLGHVDFVAPQSIERYDGSLVTAILDARPSAIIGSRRLAAASYVDQLGRNPLLVFPGTALERRTLLRLLERLPPGPGGVEFSKALARGLSAAWPYQEYSLHVRGAMASIAGPLAHATRELVRALIGRDYFIELGAAAQYVEWASALDAHFAPFEHDDYSEVGHAQLLLALHSGADRSSTAALAGAAEFEVANRLLVIDNDVDVRAFVRDLGSGDLVRFRELVRNLARPGRTREERDELIRMWNLQIGSYEQRPERLRSFGIAGAFLSSAGYFADAPQLAGISAVLLPLLLTLAQEDGAKGNAAFGQVLDTLNARLAGAVHRDAVLLARMRKTVKGMKSQA